MANIFGILFTALFALGFAGFGSVAVFLGIKKLMSGQGGLQEPLVLLALGIVFGFFGYGLIWAMIWGKKTKTKEDLLREQFPLEPWNWREDWAKGQIVCTTYGALVGVWLFTIIWNLLSSPLYWVIPEEYFEKNNTEALIGLLFPFVGFGFLVFSIYLTLRWLKYGKNQFLMDGHTGVLGGELKGTILMSRYVQAKNGFRLRLYCLHRYTSGSGDSRSTHEKVLWESEQKLPQEAVFNQGNQALLSVAFKVPYDCQQSQGDLGEDGIHWMLALNADVSGVDLALEFNVPVFKTENSDAELTQKNLQNERIEKMKQGEASLDIRGVRLGRDSIGNTTVSFGAARNLGAAFNLTIFTLIWTAIVVFLFKKNAPMLFPVVFSIVEFFLIIGLINMWFATTKLTLMPKELLIKNGYLGLGFSQSVLFNNIAELSPHKGMQSGKTVYYNIMLRKKDGRKVYAGRGIRSKQQAEHLIALLKQHL